ncbi:MAG TPA: helix-turn-helix domain-containing protein [Acidimicrobiales bacterium]|nr:helix-turn-helix domain-containing protein [Acidimicrobiales bacterium]
MAAADLLAQRPGDDDPVRRQLLDAAAEVFAEEGYEGTRIHEIVRRAGLSTGAVYGRFSSKDELLSEAVITRSFPHAVAVPPGTSRVAELIERLATRTSPPLRSHEALLLEAYVAARRHPEIASAIGEANSRWREAAQVLVDAARSDGTLAEEVDPASVLFLVRIIRLGLLLHRASGLPEPDAERWSELVARVVAGFGDHGAEPMTTTMAVAATARHDLTSA